MVFPEERRAIFRGIPFPQRRTPGRELLQGRPLLDPVTVAAALLIGSGAGLLAQAEDGAEGELPDLSIDHEGETREAAVACSRGFPEGTATLSRDPVPEWGCTGWAGGEVDEAVRIIGAERAQAGEVPTPMGQSPAGVQISNESQEEAAADQWFMDAEAAWCRTRVAGEFPWRLFPGSGWVIVHSEPVTVI